jgi:site-specific DNA-methyltransferase (adenine-specific)
MKDIDLWHGDCLELMKSIPDNSIDMILCDLPYGTTENEWDSVIDLNKLWQEYNRIIKDDGCIALFAQCPFDKILAMSNILMLRYEYIWIKDNSTGFLNANKMPLKKTENILIFYKKLPTYNPQMKTGKPYVCKQGSGSSNWHYDENCGGYITVNEGLRYPDNVLKFNTDKEKVHPTQKPILLLEYLIKTYTNQGDLILDNCMGSGSTGVACKALNRKFIGIELDEKYFEIAKQRIENGFVQEDIKTDEFPLF